jgi:hypothetical protein
MKRSPGGPGLVQLMQLLQLVQLLHRLPDDPDSGRTLASGGPAAAVGIAGAAHCCVTAARESFCSCCSGPANRNAVAAVAAALPFAELLRAVASCSEQRDRARGRSCRLGPRRLRL